MQIAMSKFQISMCRRGLARAAANRGCLRAQLRRTTWRAEAVRGQLQEKHAHLQVLEELRDSEATLTPQQFKVPTDLGALSPPASMRSACRP